MRNSKYINIIKTERGVWQIKFAWLVLWEYENLQEAKDFAINYQYWKIIEVVVWDDIIEEIEK